jgi:hypothetical protein
VSVVERGDDSRRLLLEGYDHHQPSAWAENLLEEAFAERLSVRLPMVWRRDRGDECIEMRGKLWMAPRRDDVISPGVFEQDDANPVWRRRLGAYGATADSR